MTNKFIEIVKISLSAYVMPFLASFTITLVKLQFQSYFLFENFNKSIIFLT